MKPVELAVNSTVRMFKNVWRGQLLGSAVKVGDRQFPRIQTIARECAETLHIATPQVYIVSSPSLNAATYGTNEESFIMVHSALVDHYTDDELRMVIGHECGHIHNSHVVYLTTLHYLTRMAGVFVRWAVEPALMALRAWSRRAEITCDRAGMLCSKDEERGGALADQARSRLPQIVRRVQRRRVPRAVPGAEGLGGPLHGGDGLAPVPAEACPRDARVRRERAVSARRSGAPAGSR